MSDCDHSSKNRGAMFESSLSLVIPSRSDELTLVVDKVETFAREGGFGDKEIMYLNSSLYEALTNAIEHGNAEDESKVVEIKAAWKDSGLNLRIKDEGAGFLAEDVEDPRCGGGIFGARGRGLLLMRKMMDSVIYNDRGNEVSLLLKRKES